MKLGFKGIDKAKLIANERVFSGLSKDGNQNYRNNIAVPTAINAKLGFIQPKRIAFTGHREMNDENIRTAKSWIIQIEQKYPDAVIITGGAFGVDMLIAKYAINAGLKSKIFLPFDFETFTANWKEQSKQALSILMLNSETSVPLPQEGKLTRKGKEIIEKENYDVTGYFRRNEKMVDDSNLVIAFWDGRKEGGTYATISYAISVDKPVYLAYTKQRITRDDVPSDDNFYEKIEEYQPPSNFMTSDNYDGTDEVIEKSSFLYRNRPDLYEHFISADYEVFGNQVFARHEDLSYRDSDSKTCSVKLSLRCSTEKAKQIAEFLKIVDLDGKMYKDWIKWFKTDFNRTFNYLQKLYHELYLCEPNAEIEAIIDFDGRIDPEVRAAAMEYYQSYNSDPSEDSVDELLSEGREEIRAETAYGFHKVDMTDYTADEPEQCLFEIRIGNINKGNQGVYVGRGTPLGNPFVIGKDGTREEVITKYRSWLWKEIQQKGKSNAYKELCKLAKTELLTLICHCAPKPCHAEVIREAIYWLRKTATAKRRRQQ